jgi:hypothetical protein
LHGLQLEFWHIQIAQVDYATHFWYYSLMPRQISRKLLGLLLTAMMLATSVIPPGYRHSHEGGNDLSHGHADVSHSVSDRFVGNVFPETCHDSHFFDGCLAENSLGDDKTHLHFKIFGISVALPETNRSNEKSGEDSHDNQFVSIRASEDILPVTQSNSDARNLLVPISQDFTPHSIAVFAIPYSLQSATSTLLCDRARHERSGVQLI